MRPRREGFKRAPRHRSSRKHYAVAVSRATHAMLPAIARYTDETPGRVIERALLERKE